MTWYEPIIASGEHDTARGLSYGDTHNFRSNPISMFDKHIEASPRSGLINNMRPKAPVSMAIMQCMITPGEVGPSSWGARLHGVTGVIDNLTVLDLGRPHGTKHKDGHPLYLAPAGVLDIKNSVFMRNGGNLQIAWRESENAALPLDDGVVLALRSCYLAQNSWNAVGGGGGGASQATFQVGGYNKGPIVAVTSTTLSNKGLPQYAGSGSFAPSARGLLVVHPIDPDLKVDLVYLKRDTLHAGLRPDRPVVAVSGTREVFIEDILSTGLVDVHIDPIKGATQHPLKAQKVYVNNWQGEGRLFIKGEERGQLADFNGKVVL